MFFFIFYKKISKKFRFDLALLSFWESAELHTCLFERCLIWAAAHCYTMLCSQSQTHFLHLFTTQSLILTEQNLVLQPMVHTVLPRDVKNTMEWCRKTGPTSLKSLSITLPSYNSKVSSLVTWPHMPCVTGPHSDWWRQPIPDDSPFLHVNTFMSFLGNVFSQSVTC